MIQKGIVESIVSPYEYKVRIPRYDKLSTTPGGVQTVDLSSAIICSAPGAKIAFSENDIVLVGFENDELNKPVILGLLYREDNLDSSKFKLENVQESLSELESSIRQLISNKLYTHVKYSNDNGTTFTSLYEYTSILSYSTSYTKYHGADNIIIDPNSKIIYWSVIDSNYVDVTSSLNIVTTLSTDDNPYLTESFSDTLIEVPIKFQGLNSLKLSFRILDVSDYDSYHIVLTTDKNTLGSVYGDYIGICVSTDPIPPLVPSSYSWMSSYDITKKLVEKLEANYLPRIERNERNLYGFTYSDAIQETSGTGLLDGIRVSVNDIHIHGADNKNVIFNSANTIYIDNSNDNLTTRELVHTNTNSTYSFSESYATNGHLLLVVMKKAD